MKKYPLTIVLSVLVLTTTLMAQPTTVPTAPPVPETNQPITPPATQPLITPRKVSIDLDNTTTADVIAKLSEITALPMKWQGRSSKRFSLHEKDRPLLDVIADICVQGSCLPRSNYQPGNMVFTSTPTPPLGVYRPNEMTLVLLNSMQCQERIDLKNNGSKAQSCGMQLAIIFDPAAQIAAVRGFEIDRVQGEDGAEYPNNGDSWGQQLLRLDPISAWDVQGQVDVQASLGKKMSVFGVIRAYVLQDFAQLAIDDPTTPDKTFGNDELKCTVDKYDSASAMPRGLNSPGSLSLKLEGSLIKAYGPQRLQEFLRGGPITGLDQNDQPLTFSVQPNVQESSVQLILRPANGTSWKDAGPASILIRLPRAARQIEIPVEMHDLAIR